MTMDHSYFIICCTYMGFWRYCLKTLNFVVVKKIVIIIIIQNYIINCCVSLQFDDISIRDVAGSFLSCVITEVPVEGV